MDESGDEELTQRRDWVRYFCDGFLWPDADWLQDDERGFSYWPGRLGQHVAVDEIAGGHLKWRWRMPVVQGITRRDLAAWMCLRLNEFACGWSFVVDPADATLSAIAAVSAPIDWDRYLLRFANGAKLAGWFCDTIVDDLARVLGGTPAFSAPGGHDEPRVVPDALAYLPTAIRERPEWVFDPVPYRFGSLDDMARLFVGRMGDAADRSEVDDGGFTITTLRPDGEHAASVLRAAFDVHRLLGSAWRTDVVLPLVPGGVHASAASVGAWRLYDDPVSSLLGAWVSDGDALVYRQWATTDELRSYEQLQSFGGHTADLLWSITSTSSDALAWAMDADWEAVSGAPAPGDIDATLGTVIGALGQGGRALTEIWRPHEDAADRRLLWWQQLAVLIVVGWFNPMGPTLSTLELRRDPTTGRVRLLWLMRHPFLPQYVDLGPCETDDELDEALRDGMDRLCQGNLPNVVSLAPCPGDLAERVHRAFQDAAADHVWDPGEGFAETAARIRDTLGQPWAYAGGQRDDRFDARISERPPIRDDAGFVEWLDIAVDELNFAANMSTFPDAWDGSLNFQRSAGTLDGGPFDLGPFLLTYSSIGRSEPDAAG